MIKEAAPKPTTLLSRGDRLVLVFVATPFFGICSSLGIVLISRMLDYKLFGPGEWGIVIWALSQTVGCIALFLALALAEIVRNGGLWKYTVLGAVAGLIPILLASGGPALPPELWIPPLQYGLIGHLLGRIAYRGVNRPASAPDSTSGAKDKSEKET